MDIKYWSIGSYFENKYIDKQGHGPNGYDLDTWYDISEYKNFANEFKPLLKLCPEIKDKSKDYLDEEMDCNWWEYTFRKEWILDDFLDSFKKNRSLFPKLTNYEIYQKFYGPTWEQKYHQSLKDNKSYMEGRESNYSHVRIRMDKAEYQLSQSKLIIEKSKQWLEQNSKNITYKIGHELFLILHPAAPVVAPKKTQEELKAVADLAESRRLSEVKRQAYLSSVARK